VAVRVHVDTDIGDDPDDLCALAYLLARPDVDLVGVTTVDDPDGRRTGLAREVLGLAGATAVPVAPGADVAAVCDLLAASVARGAVVLGIGPATTLAAGGRARPGLLGSAHVVLMGGWLDVPPPGFPAWPASRDTNVVRDVAAAREVRRAAGRLTVVPLAATVQTHLRSRDLPRLVPAGPLGARIARDVSAHRDGRGTARLAADHERLPDDLALLLHDPLAAAVAAGWPGVSVESRRLRTAPGDPDGRLEPAAADDPQGRDVGVVVDVDGPAFAEHWLSTVEARGPDQPGGSSV
jgi:inosine-uridine nucleoside N-ribohydrolase